MGPLEYTHLCQPATETGCPRLSTFFSPSFCLYDTLPSTAIGPLQRLHPAAALNNNASRSTWATFTGPSGKPGKDTDERVRSVAGANFCYQKQAMQPLHTPSSSHLYVLPYLHLHGQLAGGAPGAVPVAADVLQPQSELDTCHGDGNS